MTVFNGKIVHLGEIYPFHYSFMHPLGRPTLTLPWRPLQLPVAPGLKYLSYIWQISQIESFLFFMILLKLIKVLETPANNRFPMHPLQVTVLLKIMRHFNVVHFMQTPMVTPKFDTTQLSRTVSRVAKAGEVYSLYLNHYSNT